MRRKIESFSLEGKMRLIKRIAMIFFLSSIIAITLVFVLENQQRLELNFFSFTTASLPISLYIVVSFLIGMFIGPASAAVARGLGRQNKSFRRSGH